MIEEKMISVLDILIEKTKSSKVIWETTASESRFVATFSNYSVRTETVSYSNNVPDYAMSLLNEDGIEIERLEARMRDDPHYEKLEGLFKLARGTAYNVAEGLDSILKSLEE